MSIFQNLMNVVIKKNVVTIKDSIIHSVTAGADSQFYNSDISSGKVIVKIRADVAHDFDLIINDSRYMYRNVLNGNNLLVDYYFEQSGDRKVIIFNSIGQKSRLMLRNNSGINQNYEIQIEGVL